MKDHLAQAIEIACRLQTGIPPFILEDAAPVGTRLGQANGDPGIQRFRDAAVHPAGRGRHQEGALRPDRDHLQCVLPIGHHPAHLIASITALSTISMMAIEAVRHVSARAK